MPTLPDDLLKIWREQDQNQDQIPQNQTPQESHTDWDIVEDALKHISPDCTRNEWRNVGMALQQAGHQNNQQEAAFRIWNEWSSNGTKYKEREMQGQWKSFKPTGGITIGTLFQLAQDAGWKRPLPNVVELFSGVKADEHAPM